MPKKTKTRWFWSFGFWFTFSMDIFVVTLYKSTWYWNLVVTEKDGGIMLLMAVNEHESFRVENSYATNTKIVLLQFSFFFFFFFFSFFFFYVAHRDHIESRNQLWKVCFISFGWMCLSRRNFYIRFFRFFGCPFIFTVDRFHALFLSLCTSVLLERRDRGKVAFHTAAQQTKKSFLSLIYIYVYIYIYIYIYTYIYIIYYIVYI